MVELHEAKLAEFARLFDSFQGRFADFLDAYSDEQLAAIADFLIRAAQLSRAAMAQLNLEGSHDDGVKL